MKEIETKIIKVVCDELFEVIVSTAKGLGVAAVIDSQHNNGFDVVFTRGDMQSKPIYIDFVFCNMKCVKLICEEFLSEIKKGEL